MNANEIAEMENIVKEIKESFFIAEIVMEAKQIFVDCGFPKDFCLQCVSGGCIVFGGWNRVLFFASCGWQVSRSHCSKKFLEAWDKRAQNNI